MENIKRVRIGVVGSGFGCSFFFHKHPNSEVVAVSAYSKEERNKLKTTYHCDREYDSLSQLLQDKRVDAVALFTPAPLHAQHSVEALLAGKHVLCAVPIGMTEEECGRVKRAVQETGLIYMMAETSVYRQDTISVRKFYDEGLFGRILEARAIYHHPGLEHYFFNTDGQPTWRHGLPPMLYATHCTAFLIAVTGDRLTSVSCLGWGDGSPLLEANPYQNSFWNETALFETKMNTVFQVNINWKGAMIPAERCEWHGEKMSFYSADPKNNEAVIIKHTANLGQDDAGFTTSAPIAERYEQVDWWDTSMLPKPLRINSGHHGSHTFITHEFIDAIFHHRKPNIGIEEAIAYTMPGIIAHQSALKSGERLQIPSYESL